MSPKTRTLTTAWVFDDGRIQKAERPSTQLLDDPFNYGDGEGGLQTPPYSMEQLVAMLETNSLHYRACKQKATDTLGRGLQLRARELEGDTKPSAQEEDRWGVFQESVEDDERGDEPLKERLVHAAEDFESIGWGILEVSRNGSGELDGLWHVPGHTIRAHRDGRRFAQSRGGKTVWFKRFGIDGEVARADGTWYDKSFPTAPGRGNELIVVRNYTPRSSFYGLPDHIPALPALAGWRAQAEFNVRFFDNHAVPSYAVVVEGADITPELEEMIYEHFRKLKGEPHKTLVLPIPGAGGDESAAPKVRFERLSVDVKDASFRMYKQDNALELCIAHGVPPYRIGWPIVGSLGGSTAVEMTQIYNDSIVQPRQETWEQRLDRTLLGKKGLAFVDHELKAAELDVRNEARDLEKAKILYELGVATPNDNARFFGFDTREDGDQHIPVPLAPGASAPLGAIDAGLIAKRWRSEVGELVALRKRIEAIVTPDLAAAA